MSTVTALRRSARSYAELFGRLPFTLLFAGRMTSTLGDNLYLVASTWLVYDLTGSTFYAGVAGFLGYVPTIFKFTIGPVVDRYAADTVLAWSELAQLVIVLVVPLVALSGDLGIMVVLGIIPFLSASSQVSKPAQYALLPRILSEERLLRANSLFSLSYRGVQAVGKSLGGVLVAATSAVAVYVLNAGTFLLSAIIFFLIPIEERVAVGDGSRDRSSINEYLGSLRTGVLTVVRSQVLTLLLIGTALANFTTGMTTAVLPAFGDLFGGAAVYGILYAAVGVGLFAGSLIGGELSGISLRWLLVGGFGLSGFGWIATGLSPSLSVALICLVAAWISLGIYNVTAAAAIQTGVPDDRVGRVKALDGSLSGIMTAAALLAGGHVGDVVGSRVVVAATGSLLIVLALGIALFTINKDLPTVDAVGDGEFVSGESNQGE